MSDDKNSIPLIDSNSAPPVTIPRKRKSTRQGDVLKIVVFVCLVILVLILIAALVASLFRRCDSDKSKEEKKEKIPREVRKNNSFWNEFELPNLAHPTSYSLTLQLLKEAVNLSQHHSRDYFFGQVDINITMNTRSKLLVLHTKDLKIISLKVHVIGDRSSKKKPEIVVVETFYDKFYQQLSIVFNQPLLKSKSYTLEVLYSGNITISKSGIIRTFYRNFRLNKVYDILYSKLEPIGARRMFPCFDEPDSKSLFTVKVIHNSKYTALSNMPIVARTEIARESLLVDDNDLEGNSTVTLSSFNTTFVPMSTYLVAFTLVEDFKPLTRERKPGFNVSVWSPEDMEDSRDVSLSYAIASENFLENYLNYSSPLPKNDHIYIPNFLSGAMENWGLITYREKHLLMKTRQAEFLSKKAYMTIAHELAHIWFGNWVTMKTFKDLWLNEGFATYFASLAYFTNVHLSTMKAEELFLFYHRQILEKDDKVTSNPVQPEVTDFKSMFNSFTYAKGQSLLVWLNSIMGEPKFRSGIQVYVKKYAKKNPTTEQFFSVMQRQGVNDVTFQSNLSRFFEPWLKRSGYPVVNVNYDIGNKKLLLSQHSVIRNSTENTTWPIYTTVKSDQQPLDQPLFFQQKYFSINYSLDDKDFVIVNGEGKSYVRVNYSGYLWGKIIDGIRSNSNQNINAMNRIVLFDDLLYFARNDMVEVSITKSMIDTLVNETNIVPWTIFYNRIFSKVHELLIDDAIYQKWSNYIQKLSKKALDVAMTIPDTGNLNVDDEIYQRQIYLLSCEVDNRKVLDKLSDRFNLWISNPKTEILPKHLVTTILYYGIKTNDRSDHWMKMWKLLTSNEVLNSVTKDELAIGLAGTTKPYLLNKLLHYVIRPHTHSSDIDKHFFFNNLITWLIQSSNGLTVLRQWIMRNQKSIIKYAYGDNVPRLTAMSHVDNLLGQISRTIYDKSTIASLLTLHGNPLALMKTINENNRLREKLRKILNMFL